jgi:uncharacterized membrane protein YbhN (UPF0104 family)
LIPKARNITALAIAVSVFAVSVNSLSHFQWRDVFAQLRGVDFVRLAIEVWIVHFAYVVVRAWRWRIAIRHANPSMSFLDFYWITAIVVSLSILTPGQFGEALKVELLKRRGLMNRLPGLGAFVLERLLDLLVVAGMGLGGFVFGSGLAKRHANIGIGAAVLVVLALLALYILLRFDPGGRASHWLVSMRSGTNSPGSWIAMALLTICSWALVTAGWLIVLAAVQIHLSVVGAVWLISLVTLGVLLSFIPGGVGISEVLAAAALTNMGILSGTAQTGALMLRMYALMVVLFGLAHLAVWSICRLPSSIRYHGSTD